MTTPEFFTAIQDHFDDALPFVVYRKPNAIIATALLQENDILYKTEEYQESGFVFAPFDGEALDSVLIPSTNSSSMTVELSSVDTEEMPEIDNAPIIFDDKGRDRHIQLVQKGIETINTGVMKKVVLSRKQKKQHTYESPLHIFKRLVARYPTAFVYCWYHPKVGLWLGATPETLLSISNRKLQTMSLAGTQRYKDTLDVSWGAKESEEQQLVTDSIVSNLKPLVNELQVSPVQTHKAGMLLHLKTAISAHINEAEVTLKAVIKALHPTPAVCGLPKEAAKDFILKNENYARSYYTGFLGEINISTERKRASHRKNVENLVYKAIKKQTHLFVNLRCMEIDAQGAQLYVGGGVTGSSEPEAEWEETVQKLSTIARVLK